MFSIFGKKEPSPSREQKFWDWFLSKKGRIERFIDSEHRDYSIYNRLTAKMRDYSKQLIPELTKTKEGKYVLIITPDGIKTGIEPTILLASAKPDIDNWVVEKFRQPCDEITLNFKGLSYPSSDIEILAEIDSEKQLIDIHVFIRDMNRDPDNYESLAFLYFDHILGEFNTLTKVGFIDFHNLAQDKRVENSLSLVELRELIVKELY